MIYFISGHRDLSYVDFEKFYITKIESILEEDPWAEFVVGDYYGVDKYAMDYIYNNTSNDLTIYHMFESPRNTPEGYEKSYNPLISTVHFRANFKSDEERDSAMTRDSDFDIAFILEGRIDSGTGQNILRRATIK